MQLCKTFTKGKQMTEQKCPELTEGAIREIISNSETNGVYFTEIPNDLYHSGPGISSSDIKTLINGTVGKLLHRKNSNQKESQALRLGTMIHMRVLEENLYRQTYVLGTPKVPARNTKDGKEKFKEWCELHEDLYLKTYQEKMDTDQWKIEFVKWQYPDTNFVTHAENEIIEGISKSILEHDQIAKLLKGSMREASLYWIDKETNILCKSRPDVLNLSLSSPCLLDLKSCQNGGLDEFEGDVTARDYHVSASWYLWGFKEVFGMDIEHFIYVPCEKEPPYHVSYYIADEGSINIGEGLYRAGLKIYQRYLNQSKQGNVWTGHSKVAKTIGVRPWAMNKLSQVIAKHDLHNMGLEKYVQ